MNIIFNKKKCKFSWSNKIKLSPLHFQNKQLEIMNSILTNNNGWWHTGIFIS